MRLLEMEKGHDCNTVRVRCLLTPRPCLPCPLTYDGVGAPGQPVPFIRRVWPTRFELRTVWRLLLCWASTKTQLKQSWPNTVYKWLCWQTKRWRWWWWWIQKLTSKMKSVREYIHVPRHGNVVPVAFEALWCLVFEALCTRRQNELVALRVLCPICSQR